MAIVQKLKTFIDNARHVLSISYKPTNEEFKRSAKLIIIGILIIGAIGFVIGIIVSLLISGSLSVL
ncbi:MAG: protein translocase SEC61 complex subunit gamma [Rhabdochlamydiaceae bacterium]